MTLNNTAFLQTDHLGLRRLLVIAQDGHTPVLVCVLHLEHNTLLLVACSGWKSGHISKRVELLTILRFRMLVSYVLK